MDGGDEHGRGERNVDALRRLDVAFHAADFAQVQASLTPGRKDAVAQAVELGDLGALMLELVDPEVVIDMSHLRRRFVAGDRWEGVDGWIRFWADWLTPWRDFRYETGDHDQIGDHVIRAVRIVARGMDSGVPVEWSSVQLWTFREGRIVGVRVFETHAEARRWIGESRG
jgi:ketosteroid isomerase-like protein